jgi:hypothetical protein
VTPPFADHLIAGGDSDGLVAAVDNAAPGDTILLEPGTYVLDSPLEILADDVYLGSATGSADDVVLDRLFGSGDGVVLRGGGIELTAITIANTLSSSVLVAPFGTAIVEGAEIYALRSIDSMNRSIRVVAGPDGAFADGGLIACSTFTMTDEARAAYDANCRVGGPRLSAVADWVVRDNRMERLWCSFQGSGAGVSVEDRSRNIEILRNEIIDAWIGIRLGQDGMADVRSWPDDPCDALYETHVYGGVVRNNAVVRSAPELFDETVVDAGLIVWAACDTSVDHNTIMDAQSTYSGLEIRFMDAAGGTQIRNNVMTDDLRIREGPIGGMASANLAGNFDQVDDAAFVDIAAGDYHLAPESQDDYRSPGVGVVEDIDGDARADPPNAGADEFLPR